MQIKRIPVVTLSCSSADRHGPCGRRVCVCVPRAAAASMHNVILLLLGQCDLPSLRRATRGEHNATARSELFLRTCGDSVTSWQWLAYSNLTWWSAPEHALARRACDRVVRIGPAGEGGKFMCDPGRLARKQCLVVSVGLNSDTSFEVDLHSRYPHCTIHGFDGTLKDDRAELRSKLPAFLRFHPHNFNSSTHAHFAKSGMVDVLKIDCDTCEHHSLLPWLARICTDEILLEYHTGLKWWSACGPYSTTPRSRIREMHRFFGALDKEYDIFAYEDNEIVAKRNGHPGFCGEYALKRRRPCAALDGGSSVVG